MRFFLILGLMMALGDQGLSVNRPAITTSICEIATDPAKWDGARVSISSEYITDLRHGAVLTDKACPSVSMQENPIVEGEVDKSVSLFDKAVNEYPLTHKLLNYKVQVVGTFRRATDDLRASHGLYPGVAGEITIEKVDKFTRLNTSP